MPMLDIIYGVLLVLHGLVHLAWFAPTQPDEFPFRWKSLLLPHASEATLKRYISPMIVAQAVLFALAALGVWGVPLLAAAWVPMAIVAVALSTTIMVLLWHPWFFTGPAVNLLILGKAIWDLGLIR